MDFLAKLQADREIDVKFWRKHPELRKQLVEDAYQHKAHFIYELLQNAEDAQASGAVFDLHANRLEFRHNGERLFTETDVDAITDVSKSGKPDTGDTIGKFGIGFKSVFQYTEAPSVYSGEWSFRISDFVYPEAVLPIEGLESDTLFVFPFNDQRKSPQEAFEEIEAGLQGLAETTLLFLSNLKRIHWRVNGEDSGEIRMVQHSKHHVEVLKEVRNRKTASSHFLRFSVSAEGLPRHRVSVAFALDLAPNITAFDPEKPIAKQLKIVPAIPGRVAAFFPAEEEQSGLRFHLHGPFVTVLNRASIKETPANEPLFRQLARLAAASLDGIRALKLLSGEFLGVLPNPLDDVPPRYQPIRAAIIEEMKNKPLTPTHGKAHAPAKHLLQARASLKELLTEEDLRFLVSGMGAPSRWAIGATQKNSNQDRFLEGLAITEWDISQFVNLLSEKCGERSTFVRGPSAWVWGPDPAVMKWFAAKPVEWHQQMYALLYREVRQSYSLSKLGTLLIVRISDGSYRTGSQCYFPTETVQHDEVLPRVDRELYSSGKNKTQQEDARSFLKAMGVREVGEAEEIESVLKQRYIHGALRPDLSDMERFIRLYEHDPAKAGMFKDYYIFKLATDRWDKPAAVFLDSPYLETSLAAYFDALGATATKWPLSQSYEELEIGTERLVKFATAVGVQTKLIIQRRSTAQHELADDLRQDHGYRVRETDTAIDDDWMIPNLEQALKTPSEALSRLLWRTLCECPKKVLKARYRPNQQYETREEPSSWVVLLQEYAWVPQSNGEFVSACDASRALLPRGFPFDEGYEWLNAVGFAAEENDQAERHRQKQAKARELGFENEESLRFGQRCAALPPELQQRLERQIERWTQSDLPDQSPRNPERRGERVMQQVITAPDRITEKHLRSIAVGLEEVKQEAEQYLRDQYTTDSVMYCQVCQAPLPFKLDDGSYYVEKVEFLPELRKRHYQNYLALCPLHGAMYQHANGSRDEMREMFMQMEGQRLDVVLARVDATIYFTKTHIADLRVVIAADEDAEPGEEDA
jgi:hypothetical protein